jgi:hypothetical protein
VGGGVELCPLCRAATGWPIVPAAGDYDDGKFCGRKIGRGNRSPRSMPAPSPLCPPQFPLDQTWDQTQDAAVESQRLIAWAMTRHVAIFKEILFVLVFLVFNFILANYLWGWQRCQSLPPFYPSLMMTEQRTIYTHILLWNACKVSVSALHHTCVLYRFWTRK